MSDDNIIIKKIKKGGHGHHGGAWKVAYADFVTAMMAFFLLMWLLNATEAENLAGLADYFAPTVGVQGKMGVGFRGGKGALSKGIGADKNTNRGIVFGGVPSGPIMKVTEKFDLETQEADEEKLKIIIGSQDNDDSKSSVEAGEAAQAFEDSLNDEVKDSNMENSVSVSTTPDGLEIQLIDSKKESMFIGNSAKLKPRIIAALTTIGEVVSHMPNYLSITGHTSSKKLDNNNSDYGLWELASDRANAARRVFIKYGGVQPEQIARVVGKADTLPHDYKNPDFEVNNRITLTLLKKTKIADHKNSAPSGVFIDIDESDAKKFLKEGKVVKEYEKKTNTINTDIQSAIEDMEQGDVESDEGDSGIDN